MPDTRVRMTKSLELQRGPRAKQAFVAGETYFVAEELASAWLADGTAIDPDETWPPPPPVQPEATETEEVLTPETEVE